MQITGSSSSRLSELRKYAVTDVFSEQYPSGGNINNDGVDFSNSIENENVIYYIGGIKYIDLYVDDIVSTNFIYTPTGIVDYTDYPIYKDPNKESKVFAAMLDGVQLHYLTTENYPLKDVTDFITNKYLKEIENLPKI